MAQQAVTDRASPGKLLTEDGCTDFRRKSVQRHDGQER